MFIDSHCHLESFKNLEDIIRESKKSLDSIITCGHSIESSRQNVEIAKNYEGFVYPVVGIGPQSAMHMKGKNWEIEIPDSAVAIGEVGLDYHLGKSSEEKQLQKECFEYFLDIAVQADLPVVIHSRESHADIIQIIEEKNLKKVCWHCFSGSVQDAEYAISKGHYVSFIPLQSRTRAEIAKLPGIKTLIETDAPYIGKFPWDVVKSAELISSYRQVKLEEIEKETRENAKSFFKI